MKTSSLAIVLGLALGLGVFADSVRASGTYTGRLPQPKVAPRASTEMERAYYALGQRIFSGKEKLTAVPGADVQAQQKQLTALQGLLPKRAAKTKNLTTFTGKLTEDQLRALNYYVKRRFTPKADVQP